MNLQIVDPMTLPGMKEAHAALFPGVLRIGRRFKCPVVDLSDASIVYQRERDDSGEGASTFPDGVVTLRGKKYRVSYNGRVWQGVKPWKSGDVPLMVA